MSERRVHARRRGVAMLVLTAIVLVPGFGCDPPERTGTSAAPAPWFAERAAASGLVFKHESGHRGRFFLPEIMCGGAALFDMDGDGDLDVYLVQAGDIRADPATRPPNQLFRNRGDGTFEDVTADSGAGDRGYGMGVATGDVDNDGDVDLYVTNCGPNVLLRNDGQGRFTDVTAAAGVGDAGWGASAAFVDYDHDGDLDLFVTNYLNWSVATELECYHDLTGVPDYCSPSAYQAPTVDVLYRNNGDGTFSDVTDEAGIGRGMGTGLGIVAGDFDGDGWVDIFVANDGMMDRLWMNDGAGRLTDRAIHLGCAVDENGDPKAGMGVTAADFDDDGDLDLLVCNIRSESDSLHRNDGGLFVDRTAKAGLAVTSRPFTRFGMAWIDFDNDGSLDLYQANGAVTQFGMTSTDDPFAEPNLLFRGTTVGRFHEVLPRGGTGKPLVATSRAAAFGDVDNDGGIDILVVNRDMAPYLLRNTVQKRGHWAMFRAVGKHGGDAIGATVTMTIDGHRVTRDVRTAYSYCAANDPRIHVGLGPHLEVTDVVVRWVDGVREAFGSFPADGIHTLSRGNGTLDDSAGQSAP